MSVSVCMGFEGWCCAVLYIVDLGRGGGVGRLIIEEGSGRRPIYVDVRMYGDIVYIRHVVALDESG